MKKRILASLMSLCLIVGLLPTAALAVDEPDGDPSPVCTCGTLCTEEAVDDTCPVCVEDYKLCTYEVSTDKGEATPCTVTEGCTLDAGHDGECVITPTEPVCSGAGCEGDTNVEGCPLFKAPADADSNNYHELDEVDTNWDDVTINNPYDEILSITANVEDANNIRLDVVYATPEENPMAGITYQYMLDGELVTNDAVAQEYILVDGQKELVTDVADVTSENWDDVKADCTVYLCAIPDGASEITATVNGLTYWEYDEPTAALSITGEGCMAAFYTTSGTGHPDSSESKGSRIASFPWHKQQLDIESVTIGDGITCIGSQAFRKLVSLSSVTFGSDLEEIGRTSFMDDTALELVDLSGCTKLKAIGDQAFLNLKQNSTIKVANETVYHLLQGSINYTQGTTEVTFVGLDELVDGDWTAVELSDDTCKIIGYTGEGGEITIPASISNHSVVQIESGLFRNNTAITKVSFAEGSALTDIPAYFLAGASGDGSIPVTSLSVPDSVTTIGESAFTMYSSVLETLGINGEKLTRIEELGLGNLATSALTDKTFKLSSNLTYIGKQAFKNDVLDLQFVAGDYSNLEIAADAFDGFVGSVTFASGATNYDTLLNALIDSKTVQSIKIYSDEQQQAYTEYTIGENSDVAIQYVGCEVPEDIPQKWNGLTVTKVIMESCIENNFIYNGNFSTHTCTITGYQGALPEKLLIPVTLDGMYVTEIGDSAFAGPKPEEGSNANYTYTLKSVEFDEESVCEKIGLGAFRNQYELSSVVLADSITEIGQAAFEMWPGKLMSANQITFHFPSDLETVGHSAFWNFDFSKVANCIVLPTSVETIDDFAFRNTKASFIITSDAVTIGGSAFSGNRTAVDLSRVQTLTVNEVGENESASDNDYYTFMADQIYVSSETQESTITSVGHDTKSGTYCITNEGILPLGTDFNSESFATPIKDGYKFEGWYTKNDEGDDWGTEVTTPEANKTYYAKWTESENYSISDDDKKVSLEMTYGEQVDSKTVTVNGSEESPSIKEVTSSNEAIKASCNGMSVTITAADDLDAGTYEGTVYVHTGDDATHWISVTLEVKKADSSVTPDEGTANIEATYGDTITFVAKVAKAETGIAAITNETEQDHVAFYCGNVLLGSAHVVYDEDSNYTTGTATLYYDTSKGGIPTGDEQTVTAYYGGSVNLNNSSNNSITVKVSPKELTIDRLAAVDRPYDGTKNIDLAGGKLTGVLSGDDVTAEMPTSGTVESADAGSNKQVTISSISLSGKDAGFYTLTLPTVTVNITKAAQDAPDAPTMSSRNRTSITLNTVPANSNGAAAEYSKDGGTTWHNSPEFTGLSSGTSYTFAVRYAETGNYEASPASETASFSTTSGGSSGGSSSGSTTYAITVENSRHGEVDSNRTRTSSGTTVTLTVTPDEGYVLDELTVTDKDGDTVKLTDKGNGKYTFTMPRSAVTVEATFAETATEPETPVFTDVPADAYYADAVAWAVENGITNGTSATTFGPNISCTRAQMVTFLWRAAGSPEPTTANNPFTDVQAGSYYYDAVLWAVEQGITEGTSATTFSPDTTVTRGQTVTFLYRANGSPAVSGGSFSDVAADAYYADAVVWAVSEGITNGTSATTFSPDSACTRAQIVAFLYRDMAN